MTSQVAGLHESSPSTISGTPLHLYRNQKEGREGRKNRSAAQGKAAGGHKKQVWSEERLSCNTALSAQPCRYCMLGPHFTQACLRQTVAQRQRCYHAAATVHTHAHGKGHGCVADPIGVVADLRRALYNLRQAAGRGGKAGSGGEGGVGRRHRGSSPGARAAAPAGACWQCRRAGRVSRPCRQLPHLRRIGHWLGHGAGLVEAGWCSELEACSAALCDCSCLGLQTEVRWGQEVQVLSNQGWLMPLHDARYAGMGPPFCARPPPFPPQAPSTQ